MPSQFAKSISLGSNKVGAVREDAYVRASGGNLSRWLCELGDRELGLKLPLPPTGRPRKNRRKGPSDGYAQTTKRSRRLSLSRNPA